MGKTKPTHEIKLGVIRATIWENATEDRDSWFNVTLSRRYRSGEEWKETSSLRRDDLPVAMMALDMAYRWVWRRQARDVASTPIDHVSARTRR
jgi:hypothetical protein